MTEPAPASSTDDDAAPVAAIERIWPEPAQLSPDELRDDYRRTWPPAVEGAGAMMIASLDGSAVLGAVSGGLSSPADQKLMDLQRAAADVVVIGAGTLRSEGYGGLRVDPDSVRWRRRRGLSDHPVLAVVSRSLDLDPQAPFLSEAPVRPVVLTGDDSPVQRRERLAETAEVVVLGAPGGGVDPQAAQRWFAQRGWQRVHSEGGPAVLTRWLAAGMIAELHLSLSPVLAGSSGLGLLDGRIPARRLELTRVLRDRSMLLTRYRVQEG